MNYFKHTLWICLSGMDYYFMKGFTSDREARAWVRLWYPGVLDWTVTDYWYPEMEFLYRPRNPEYKN